MHKFDTGMKLQEMCSPQETPFFWLSVYGYQAFLLLSCFGIVCVVRPRWVKNILKSRILPLGVSERGCRDKLPSSLIRSYSIFRFLNTSRSLFVWPFLNIRSTFVQSTESDHLTLTALTFVFNLSQQDRRSLPQF